MARSLRSAGLCAIAALAASLLTPQNASAFFGIASFLNPEGTRLFPQSILFPRHPGKPDPRWKNFEWRYVDEASDGSKYRLYFYEGERWAARFTAPRIADQVADLEKVFGYTPTRRFSYLLFTSEREFRQANVFFIQEGVQGITSTQENTMAIPYWGEAQTFDHISRHELTHQFQVQKMFDLGDRYAQDKMALMPLWFIEGQAEYVSLRGIDSETGVYLRDIALHPDKDKMYTVPKFFDEGGMGFIPTYKVGQAKIDFLEKKFGRGASQQLLDAGARDMGTAEQMATFSSIMAAKLGKPVEEIEDSWESYFDLTYRKPYEKKPAKPDGSEEIKATGDTLDVYDISPDGNLIAWRDVNPLVGLTYVHVMDLRNPDSKTDAIHDNQPGAMSLYFMRFPVVAISNQWVGYVADTPSGPELEVRKLTRKGAGKEASVDLGGSIRIALHRDGFLQADSLAFSPDGRDLAIIGLDQKGWSNIYIYRNFESAAKDVKLQPHALTQSSYSWRNIRWTSKNTLLASSDRTASGRYALFQIHPTTGDTVPIALRDENVLQSDASDGAITYQYAPPIGTPSGNGPQARMISEGRESQLTDVVTGVFYPKIRGSSLFFLLFEQGRYRLYKSPIPARTSDQKAVVRPPAAKLLEPWKPVLASLNDGQVGVYRPFSSISGTRVENLSGFLTTGSYGGVSGTVSDLMRNYEITGEFFIFGGLSRTTGAAFLTSQKGRATWTLGAYRTIQDRLDNIYSNGSIYTYLYKELGVLGAVQYPLGGYSYIDIGGRTGRVSRSDLSSSVLDPYWEAVNPGAEFMVAPIIRFGYDRIQYEALSGPLRGFGSLLELDTQWFPGRNIYNKRVRLDLAQYWQLWGPSVFAFQLMGAVAWGDPYRTSFLVSSEDILRAYPFADPRLYGNYLLAAKGEVRFPFGSAFNFPFLRGIVGADLGTLYRQPGDFNQGITSSASWGFALNVPPITVQFLFTHPFRTAPGPRDSSVFHFLLRYLYL